MAILIDEYGGFSGIVTMEDLIEEIVGDIEDEYDMEEPDIIKIDDNSYYVSGAISIEDLNDAFHLELDEDLEAYDTLGGMLIYLLGYIPNDGEKVLVEHKDIKFYIEEVNERRIQTVRIVFNDKLEQ